jgi:Ser/Thr protein kinase RdoA (MazF antagonist)
VAAEEDFALNKILKGGFTPGFRRPTCFRSEINDGGTKLWLEYIEGASGEDLTVDMLEEIAEGLGRFHGKLYTEKTAFSVGNLSNKDGMKHYYRHNRTKLYNYVRRPDCPVPPHLCQMIINMDKKAYAAWEEIEKLPVVLRHGDFFTPNIFYTNDGIVLIDWDSAGWGYMGEDIVNLIADTDSVDWRNAPKTPLQQQQDLAILQKIYEMGAYA